MNKVRTHAWLKDLFWKHSWCEVSAAAASTNSLWWKEKLFLSLLVVTTVPNNVGHLAVPRNPGEQSPFISNKVRTPLQCVRCALCGTAVCPGYHIWSGKCFLRKQRRCHRKKILGLAKPVFISDTRRCFETAFCIFCAVVLCLGTLFVWEIIRRVLFVYGHDC